MPGVGIGREIQPDSASRTANDQFRCQQAGPQPPSTVMTASTHLIYLGFTPVRPLNVPLPSHSARTLNSIDDHTKVAGEVLVDPGGMRMQLAGRCCLPRPRSAHFPL